MPLQFVDTGPYPTRGGNRITPWIDGEPAFRRICEAIEAAQHSVWVTVTFMWPDFEMPDGRGSALQVLDRAARRGVDVRIIFWRPDEETAGHRRNAFWGSAEHFDVLARRHRHVTVRWDRAHPGYCQHQKSWLVDACEKSAVAFVGGINLNPHSVVMPGHNGEAQNHDVYVELSGPAVADVHHNFAQRWNGASERQRVDGRWGNDARDDLAFPEHAPPARGAAEVQIQRTMYQGRYSGDHPPVNGRAFDVAGGEVTNLDQYCAAIAAARRGIYLENQYLEVPEIVTALYGALGRGVEVVLVLPARPDIPSSVSLTSRRAAFLDARAGLAAHHNFTLGGLAGLNDDGRRTPVYVHSKLMLVDDEWATVGSCNLHHYSLQGNGELNVAFRDPATVRALRIELFQEHLGVDTAAAGEGDALRAFALVARENRQRHDRGDPDWQGLAFSLDALTYGQAPQF